MDTLKKPDEILSEDAIGGYNNHATGEQNAADVDAIIRALEKKQLELLEQLEQRMENKRLKLIYELEDQLNITLPKT